MATLADVGAVSILYMCTYAATVLVLVILKLRRTIGMLYNTIPVLLNELSWKASVVGSSLVCINWLVILISPLIACVAGRLDISIAVLKMLYHQQLLLVLLAD